MSRRRAGDEEHACTGVSVRQQLFLGISAGLWQTVIPDSAKMSNVILLAECSSSMSTPAPPTSLPWKPWPKGGAQAFRFVQLDDDPDRCVTATVVLKRKGCWHWSVYVGSRHIDTGTHPRPTQTFKSAETALDAVRRELEEDKVRYAAALSADLVLPTSLPWEPWPEGGSRAFRVVDPSDPDLTATISLRRDGYWYWDVCRIVECGLVNEVGRISPIEIFDIVDLTFAAARAGEAKRLAAAADARQLSVAERSAA